jgi:hypothetical protein
MTHPLTADADKARARRDRRGDCSRTAGGSAAGTRSVGGPTCRAGARRMAVSFPSQDGGGLPSHCEARDLVSWADRRRTLGPGGDSTWNRSTSAAASSTRPGVARSRAPLRRPSGTTRLSSAPGGGSCPASHDAEPGAESGFGRGGWASGGVIVSSLALWDGTRRLGNHSGLRERIAPR